MDLKESKEGIWETLEKAKWREKWYNVTKLTIKEKILKLVQYSNPSLKAWKVEVLLRLIKLFKKEKHHILEQEYIPKFSFIVMKISKSPFGLICFV